MPNLLCKFKCTYVHCWSGKGSLENIILFIPDFQYPVLPILVIGGANFFFFLTCHDEALIILFGEDYF